MGVVEREVAPALFEVEVVWVGFVLLLLKPNILMSKLNFFIKISNTKI